jgi:hypothetical protein
VRRIADQSESAAADGRAVQRLEPYDRRGRHRSNCSCRDKKPRQYLPAGLRVGSFLRRGADRTVVTGLIKSNLPMKVCLHVANLINSQIVIGEAGAESLLGKGDLLCDVGRGIVRAQSYFIPQQAFVKVVRGKKTRAIAEPS